MKRADGGAPRAAGLLHVGGGLTCQVLTSFPVGSYGCAPSSPPAACDLTLGITGGTAETADYVEAWIFTSSGSPLYCGGMWEIDW